MLDDQLCSVNTPRPRSRISCVSAPGLWLDAPIMSGGSGRWRALGLLSLAELLALSLWFSASAVLPAPSPEWALGDSGRAGLTIAVQAGFIRGPPAAALTHPPHLAA